MREKILYAITNCITNDLDATHEGLANMQMGWANAESEEEN